MIGLFFDGDSWEDIEGEYADKTSANKVVFSKLSSVVADGWNMGVWSIQ